MKNPMITKGKGVFITVKTETMSDKRLFTQSGKMKKFLTYLRKNHKEVKIKFKEIRLN